MLDITGDNIAALSDGDLRSLVGRLCESELRSHSLSTSYVTWGGNQNAPDGGIDVRVAIKDGEPPGGFVPRASVGYQVKKTDFIPSLIGPEMRPYGELRSSISDLIDEKGAYIIASSGSDTSDSALTDRLNAMRSAVADRTNHLDLHVDYYDRNRLATWTRNHPGLAVWVRQKIGRTISGWQPYSSWSVSPDGEQDEYLLDDKARLHVGASDGKGICIEQGIDAIRNTLRASGRVVRLAGLSGVGKTRLVQVLFDERVGNTPLDSSAVVYTDMNDNPAPQPTGMISDLIASRSRAIVVVDNCPPDLHRRITEICRKTDSLISAITIEYDVQDDEPEGTDVFRLEPSSVELVSRLLERRFPTMTQLDVDIIAEFSGGNARVALALANSLEKHESVAGLQDEELFRRLFHQRQAHDDSLLKAAQACSLLFSFHGEAFSGDEAELSKIAALVRMDDIQLYAKVAQLEERDLVQRRSVWRAILPHAIANRLAKMALREIPLAQIESKFDTVRLMKSFSRRLGFLHESMEARSIAEKWLAEGGYLANVSRLNEFGIAMFNNIAPLSPEATLAAIERVLSSTNAVSIGGWQYRTKIAEILHSIAYEASVFDRCVAVLIPPAIDEQMDRTHPTRDLVEGLFRICWSGTHATIEQRTRIVSSLLRSGEAEKHSLGIQLLGALLKSDYPSMVPSFEFGARRRNYGYFPETQEERSHWFVTALLLARQFVSAKGETTTAIRSMIAETIWSVWFLGSEVQDQFENIANNIPANDYWQEGWIAARILLSRLPDDADDIGVQRLRSFEVRLRPQTVLERTRAVVLSQRLFDYADADDCENEPDKFIEAHEKAYARAEELGTEICGNPAAFVALLPDLVRGTGNRVIPFGRGLALGSVEHRKVWGQLVEAVAATEESKRSSYVLRGYLNGLATVDQPLCESLLEDSLTHEVLSAWYPALQSSVALSSTGVDRLKRAVELGKAKPDSFEFLGWMNAESGLSADDLRTVVLSLANQNDGFRVAIDIVSSRIQSCDRQKEECPLELVDAGRILLSDPDFGVRDSSHDYHMHTVATVCLRGPGGTTALRMLCDRIKKGISDHSFHAFLFDDLLQSIFSIQPLLTLDEFFGDPNAIDSPILRALDFERSSLHRKQPLDGVPISEILQWCDSSPVERYPIISRMVSFQGPPSEHISLTPLAMEMLRRAPDPVTVLESFVHRFYPTSWSGSRASIVESRLPLLEQVGELQNSSLDSSVVRLRAELVENIARMRASEDQRDSHKDERFE